MIERVQYMKNNAHKKIIFILLLLITVGFASLTTSLYINGTISVGNNASDFDVYFSEATLDTVESDKIIFSEDRRTITYTSIKKTSVIDYKVKNNSTQYGADVTVTCDIPSSEYISIEVTFDGNTVPLDSPVNIDAQKTKKGKIVITVTSSSTESTESLELSCTLDVIPTDSDTVVDKVTDQVLYKETLLNGAYPVLGEGLIPVIIDDDGIVTYADVYSKWYSYEEKNWANAVILTNGESYSVGDTIPEDAIESYFVWIPKYKYQLWNVESTMDATNIGKHSIEIVFGTSDTTDVEGTSCATPMTSGESGNCDNDEYMTHPAFISLDVNGFWVGKFETGYNGATSESAAQVTSSDSTKVIVKPNVYSWRYNTIYNMFMTAYNYNRDLDSHMMKNTEWGAVAYLSHSVYGIDDEVNINNNSSYKTGYSSLLTIDQSSYPGTSGDGDEYNQPYNTEVGYKASTTGNISGVYDMSGGAQEYMASYSAVGSSGFTTTTIANYDSKYFDVYNSSSDTTTYEYRILGDATGEMGPFSYYEDDDGSTRYHNSWYSDDSYFINSSNSWFRRGGNYPAGVLSGQFYFRRHTGAVYDYIGSRLVLTGLSS